MGELMGLSKEEWYAEAVPLYPESQLRQLGDKWPEIVIVLDALKTVLRPASEGSPVRAPLAPLQSAEERAGRA